MKNSIKKGTVETYITFFLSPLFSIPLILLQLKKRDNSVLILVALFFGYLSFLYIPSISNDKAEYYSRYAKYLDYDFGDLINYLKAVSRPDFVFEFIIYFFARLNINIQLMFFFLTSFTVYSIFAFVKEVVNKYVNGNFYFTIFTTLLIIFSLSFSGLLSGIRFYFATGIFIWSIYFLFFQINIRRGVLLFILTLFTHFSFAFFIPAIILVYLFPANLNPKIVLGFSLLFLFLPKDFLGSIFGFLQMPESYSNKADSYMNVEQVTSENSLILNFLRNLWLYFAYFYLLFFNKNSNNKALLVLMIFLSFVNITYSVPLIFNRYTVVLKILFLTYLLFLYKSNKLDLKYLLLFSASFFINFVIDINVLRYNFIASYQLSDFYTIIHILSKKVIPYDFLR